jgi:hypothetical protein
MPALVANNRAAYAKPHRGRGSVGPAARRPRRGSREVCTRARATRRPRRPCCWGRRAGQAGTLLARQTGEVAARASLSVGEPLGTKRPAFPPSAPAGGNQRVPRRQLSTWNTGPRRLPSIRQPQSENPALPIAVA